MDAKIDEAKARLKQAAGDLTDDQGLKDEGNVDKAAASVKDKIDKVADKVKDAINPDDEDAADGPPQDRP